MSTQLHRVTLASLPPESRIAKAYVSTNLADAYSIELPSGASTNPELLARFIFSHQAPWIRGLIAFRDAIVGRFGLKTAKQLTSLGAERDRSCRHLQDLRHQSDRNCPWRRRQALGLQALCPLFQSVVAKRQTSTDFVNRGPLPQPCRSSLYSCHRPVPPLGRSIKSS
jgi:hypothetical protein